MRFIGAEPESTKYQKWLLTLQHLCNLPEFVFAHSALGSTGHARIPVHGSWHHFQLTLSYLIPVQQLVTSSTRYEIRGDNILVTLFCSSHHLHKVSFSIHSPLYFCSSLFPWKLRKHVWYKTCDWRTIHECYKQTARRDWVRRNMLLQGAL